MFLVVEFLNDDGSVGVVPSEWMFDNDRQCRWPPVRNMFMANKMVNKKVVPLESWESFPVRVLCKSGNLH